MITNNVCASCKMCCEGTILGTLPCWKYTSNGCSLTWDQRSDGCKAYPFVVVDDGRFPVGERIFIDTACPHWRAFWDELEKVK